jgi:hypothetical protein
MLRTLALLLCIGMLSSCAMFEKRPQWCSAHESLNKSGWKQSELPEADKTAMLAQLPKHKFASGTQDYWYQSRNKKVLVCRQTKACSPQTWQFLRKGEDWKLQKTGTVVCNQ